MEVFMEFQQIAKDVGLVQISAELLNCGSCTKPLYLADSIHRVPISHKRALNKPVHEDGSAIAFICDKCNGDANREIHFVFNREKSGRQRCVEVNIEDLPDKLAE